MRDIGIQKNPALCDEAEFFIKGNGDHLAVEIDLRKGEFPGQPDEVVHECGADAFCAVFF